MPDVLEYHELFLSANVANGQTLAQFSFFVIIGIDTK